MARVITLVCDKCRTEYRETEILYDGKLHLICGGRYINPPLAEIPEHQEWCRSCVSKAARAVFQENSYEVAD